MNTRRLPRTTEEELRWWKAATPFVLLSPGYVLAEGSIGVIGLGNFYCHTVGVRQAISYVRLGPKVQGMGGQLVRGPTMRLLMKGRDLHPISPASVSKSTAPLRKVLGLDLNHRRRTRARRDSVRTLCRRLRRRPSALAGIGSLWSCRLLTE